MCQACFQEILIINLNGRDFKLSCCFVMVELWMYDKKKIIFLKKLVMCDVMVYVPVIILDKKRLNEIPLFKATLYSIQPSARARRH
jgi:hypothetical protein